MAYQFYDPAIMEEPVTINDPMVSRSNGFAPPILPRPITSTLDNWDQKTPVEYGRNAASIGERPSWNIPSIAVTSESVNTIRSSVVTRAANPSIATVTAMTVSPVMRVPAAGDPRPFKPVANMSAVIKPSSDVQISWSVMISAPQNTSPRFCVYRDGRMISQEYQQVILANVRSNFAATYVDSNLTLLKNHTYTLYCRPTDFPITFYQLGRIFQASDLRAI